MKRKIQSRPEKEEERQARGKDPVLRWRVTKGGPFVGRSVFITFSRKKESVWDLNPRFRKEETGGKTNPIKEEESAPKKVLVLTNKSSGS